MCRGNTSVSHSRHMSLCVLLEMKLAALPEYSGLRFSKSLYESPLRSSLGVMSGLFIPLINKDRIKATRCSDASERSTEPPSNMQRLVSASIPTASNCKQKTNLLKRSRLVSVSVSVLGHNPCPVAGQIAVGNFFCLVAFQGLSKFAFSSCRYLCDLSA